MAVVRAYLILGGGRSGRGWGEADSLVDNVARIERDGLCEWRGRREDSCRCFRLCDLDGYVAGVGHVEGHCTTCGDELLSARVLGINQENGTALVEIADATEEVDISLVDEVTPGALLLVHGGVAIGLDLPREPLEYEVRDVH